jgi:hypothetical protein
MLMRFEENLIVETVGVKVLKTNPSALSEAFDDKPPVLTTRRSEPVSIAAPFDEQLIDLGVPRWMALPAFEDGDIQFGPSRGGLRPVQTGHAAIARQPRRSGCRRRPCR